MKIQPETENENENGKKLSIQRIESIGFDPQNLDSIKNVDKRHLLDGKFTKFSLFCLIIAVFGSSFQYGINIGIFNTSYLVIRKFFNEVYHERYGSDMPNETFTVLWSVTNGLMPLGGVAGSSVSGYMADRFGRQKVLLYSNILILLSCGLDFSSKFVRSFETILVGRFMAGIFSGLITGIIPLYLIELPPQNLRGFSGTMNQFSIVSGILVANIFGLPFLLGQDELWPILVCIVLVPGIACSIGHFFTVESPKYLFINVGKTEDAKNALIKLRGSANMELVKREIIQLEHEKERMADRNKLTWKEFFTRKSLRRPLIIAIFVKVAQHFSGINAVIYYSTKIFTSAGLSDDLATYSTILLMTIQVLMTALCMVIIEKVGRRPLIICGCTGMCFFSFCMAVTRIYGSPEREWIYYLTVVAAVCYLICYSLGLGPLSWIIATEIFESESRGKANSLATFCNWTANFLVTISFPFIEAAIKSYSFLVYGILLIFISLFMFLFVPETKNKPTEEIVSGFNESPFAFPHHHHHKPHQYPEVLDMNYL